MSTYTGSGVPPAETYFHADFDPNSLKIAQLRGILAEHEIYPASTAKKADLSELFETEVKPRAAAYLKKAAKVKPSKQGITRIGNDGNAIESPDKPSTTSNKRSRSKRSSATPRRSEAAEADDESDGEGEEGSVIQVTAPRRQSRRLSATPSVEPIPAPITKRRAKSRSSSAGIPKSASEPTGLVAGGGRLRKVPSVGVLKEESEPESDQEGLRKVGRQDKDESAPEAARKLKRKSLGDESAFSDSNPFQSGGEGSATPKERRRKKSSLGGASGSNSRLSDAAGSSSVVRKSYTTQDLQAFRDPESSPINSPAHSAPATSSRVPRTSTSTGNSPLKMFQPGVDQLKSPPQPWVEQRLAEKKSKEDLRGEAEDYAAKNVEIQEKMNQITSAAAQQSTKGEIGVEVIKYEVQPAEEMQISKRVNADEPKKARKGLLSLPVMLAIIGLLAGVPYGYNYKMESQAIGYCDTGSSTNSIIQHAREQRHRYSICDEERRAKSRALREREDYDEIEDVPALCEGGDLVPFVFHPEVCTPCPLQGECIGGEFIACAPDHIAIQPFLPSIFGTALNGLPSQIFGDYLDGLPLIGPKAFPLGCVRDMEKNRMMLQFAHRMEDELAMLRGQIICSGAERGRKKEGRKAGGLEGRVELFEAEVYGERKNEIRERFLAIKKDAMPMQQFDQLFEDALKDMLEHKEIVEHVDEFGNTYYAATRAVLPLGCRAKLALTQKAQENIRPLAETLSFLMMLFWVYSKFAAGRAENVKVKELVKVALDKLQDQQYRHYVDPSLAPEPYIAPNQLRDFVLSHEHKTSTRVRLWAKVAPIIEGNANVSVSEKELADGASWKVWQWVGVTRPSVLGGGSSERHVTWEEGIYPPTH